MWSACLQLRRQRILHGYRSAWPLCMGPRLHILYVAHADRYRGEYQNDVPHGSGSYRFASGHTYEGEWLHGAKSGYCVYSLASGQQWAGDPSDTWTSYEHACCRCVLGFQA